MQKVTDVGLPQSAWIGELTLVEADVPKGEQIGVLVPARMHECDSHEAWELSQNPGCRYRAWPIRTAPSQALDGPGIAILHVLASTDDGTEDAVIRATARIGRLVLSFAYNTSMAIFGGTAPMIAVFAIQHTQDDLSPAFYLMGAAAVSLLATISLRETSKATLR
jgi:hypothetical protein